MVTPEDAVRYIKDKIVTLIDNGTLNGTYRQSSSTISFYVNDIKSINRPLITLTLRLSDHHPTMQHNIDNNRTPSTEPNTNISIEFYKPLYDNNGNRVQNRFDNRVKTPDDIIILPFEVSYYEYCPSLLDVYDLDTIYMSILNWIGNINGAYNDPFIGTPKEAKTKTKNANIRTNFNSYITYRNSVIAQRNAEDGWGDVSQAEINWWKTKGLGDSLIRQRTIIENKQYQKTEHKMRQNKVRLSESKLCSIIREAVKSVLMEDGRYMSDEDIANQYKDMKITYFRIEPLRFSDGWEGTFELAFPNADGIDFDETMVNNFFVYDAVGKRIAWDNWMPDEQTNHLQSIIRQEIAKRNR